MAPIRKAAGYRRTVCDNETTTLDNYILVPLLEIISDNMDGVYLAPFEYRVLERYNIGIHRSSKDKAHRYIYGIWLTRLVDARIISQYDITISLIGETFAFIHYK